MCEQLLVERPGRHLGDTWGGAGPCRNRAALKIDRQYQGRALASLPLPLGLSLLMCKMGTVNQAHLNKESLGSGNLGVLTQYVTHMTQGSLYLVFSPEQAANTLTQTALDETLSGIPECAGRMLAAVQVLPSTLLRGDPSLLAGPASLIQRAGPSRGWGLSQAEGPHILDASLCPLPLGAIRAQPSLWLPKAAVPQPGTTPESLVLPSLFSCSQSHLL